MKTLALEGRAACRRGGARVLVSRLARRLDFSATRRVATARAAAVLAKEVFAQPR